MKLNTLIIALLLCFSCNNDNNTTDNNPGEEVLFSYVSSIENIGNSGSSTLQFTYDDNNNLVKNATSTYERLYSYSGGNIVKIESITLPNTPYYTIDFVYENNKVVEVQRNNHYNGTIFYTTYDYYPDGKVSSVCTYETIEDYNNAECNRFYEMSYIAGTRNYASKSLVLFSLNGSEFLEISEWDYDNANRPYFGEAVRRIQLPYSSDGTGMDWEFTYNSNNPSSKYIFDSFSNEMKLRRAYLHQYVGDLPIETEINTYSIISGEITNTFTQKYNYLQQ